MLWTKDSTVKPLNSRFYDLQISPFFVCMCGISTPCSIIAKPHITMQNEANLTKNFLTSLLHKCDNSTSTLKPFAQLFKGDLDHSCTDRAPRTKPVGGMIQPTFPYSE